MKEKGSKDYSSSPKEHKEMKVGLLPCCGEKYGSSNTMEELKKSVDGLVSYTKKNKMKY
jgi:hypothetical protein